MQRDARKPCAGALGIARHTACAGYEEKPQSVVGTRRVPNGGTRSRGPADWRLDQDASENSCLRDSGCWVEWAAERVGRTN